WSYYGDRAFEYLLGRRAIMPFRIIYCIVLFFGAIASSTTAWVGTVWAYADIANLLMAFPNLLALWLLSGVVAKSLKAYMKDYGASVLESDAPMEMAPMENEA
ncbi:MAG TPA: alanine:cation symporter family protein, partial [bacterium]|nr:alanine:cation symporter family protein [bacterium]